MTPRPRILLVEDSPLQARLVREFTADALDVEPAELWGWPTLAEIRGGAA